MTPPPRITWALSIVDPAPDDRIVELGCGPGVAAALICARLTTGHLVAVDRSATAVARTTTRNTSYMEAGLLSVVQSEVDTLELPPASASKVFSEDVNLFWTREPTSELAVLRKILEPGGELYVLYGNGPTGVDRVTPTVSKALRAAGFGNVEVLTSAAGIGVRARK